MIARHKYVRRLIIFLTIIGILSAVTTALAHGEKETVTAFSLLLPVVGTPIIVCLFFVAITLTLSVYIVKFKPNVINGVTYKFTHWGMERIADKSESTIPWRDFQKIKELKSFYLLEFKEKGVDNAHAIKKANFGDVDEQNEFIDFIEQNFSNAAK